MKHTAFVSTRGLTALGPILTFPRDGAALGFWSLCSFIKHSRRVCARRASSLRNANVVVSLEHVRTTALSRIEYLLHISALDEEVESVGRCVPGLVRRAIALHRRSKVHSPESRPFSDIPLDQVKYPLVRDTCNWALTTSTTCTGLGIMRAGNSPQ